MFHSKFISLSISKSFPATLQQQQKSMKSSWLETNAVIVDG